MPTVAVLGASSAVGRALLERLDADTDVTRLLGLDLEPPPMPVARLEFRTADVRDPLLVHALSGAETIVHLTSGTREVQDDDTLFARTVHGTRRLLEAAEKVGARRLVHVSSGAVYGAHPDNALPLEESAPARANPDFSFAYHHLLAEELVTRWAQEHPDVAVVVLRPALTLGPGVDDFVTRHLETPRLPLVRGCDPPLQLLHVDDLAAAVHLACTEALSGAYNVAADGWLPVSEVEALLHRKAVHLPEQVAFSVAGLLWQRGLLTVPPGALHYVMHPWVMSTDRLHAAGWAPEHSNREVLREFADTHRGCVSLGRVRLRSRDLVLAAFAAVGLLAGVLAGQRRRST